MKKHYGLVLCWIGCVVLSHFLKLGAFSCMAATLPVIAYFYRAKFALPMVGSAWAATHLAGMPLTLGIPTYLATLSWRATGKWSDKWLHLALPLACMLAFRLSPVGAHAWPYSLYWLLPMTLCFVNLGLVGRALKSTFVAHAVGSVIWAYATPLPSEAWLALIPAVALERALSVGWSLGLIGLLEVVRRKRQAPESVAAPSI